MTEALSEMVNWQTKLYCLRAIVRQKFC